MGFKSSSFAMAQTTRFKRKLSRTSHSSRNAFFTPPATPFNNTSFLIQLQQQRQCHLHHGSSTVAAFDQYGSMHTYMSIIPCCDNPLTSPNQSTATSPDQRRPRVSGSPSTFQTTTDPEHKFSDPDGSHMCDSGPQEINPCSDSDESSVTIRSPKLECDEGDGVQRHRHCRCFMNDNVGADLGSHNGASKEAA